MMTISTHVMLRIPMEGNLQISIFQWPVSVFILFVNCELMKSIFTEVVII